MKLSISTIRLVKHRPNQMEALKIIFYIKIYILICSCIFKLKSLERKIIRILVFFLFRKFFFNQLFKIKFKPIEEIFKNSLIKENNILKSYNFSY